MTITRRVLALMWKHPIATVFLFLMSVAVAGSYYWFGMRPWQLFWAERQEMKAILKSLMNEPPPAGVSATVWEDAWLITDAGLGNVCFTLHDVPLDEMRRLHQDIVEHAATFRSFDFMCWLWPRLAETGPKGRRCIEELTPLFEDIGNRLDTSGDGKRHGFEVGEIGVPEKETSPIIGDEHGLISLAPWSLAWAAAGLIAFAATGSIRAWSKTSMYALGAGGGICACILAGPLQAGSIPFYAFWGAVAGLVVTTLARIVRRAAALGRQELATCVILTVGGICLAAILLPLFSSTILSPLFFYDGWSWPNPYSYDQLVITVPIGALVGAIAGLAKGRRSFHTIRGTQNLIR